MEALPGLSLCYLCCLPQLSICFFLFLVYSLTKITCKYICGLLIVSVDKTLYIMCCVYT
uniref:Uncharacterized protein n=1 Tax=Arundo donax TaxID=35708 RepID=A0A0A9DGQ6_ARUDO